MKRILPILMLVDCSAYNELELYVHYPYTEIKKAAYEYWKDSGVETGSDYSLEFLVKDELETECGHLHIDGCRRTGEVYMLSGLSAERQIVVLMHEVGHLTRGNPGHLECQDVPGDDIMCPAASSNGSMPTARDVKFITEK